MTPTVFVTGGSGYLGSRLLPALIERGYEVRALVRSPEAAAVVRERGADPLPGDLTDTALLTEAMQGCTAVLHAAARLREGGSLASHRRDNVTGTQNLLVAAQAAGVQRFVLVGAAMCLLGGAPIERADEAWPLNEPAYSSYARTKTIADRAVLAANRDGFSTSVLRPGWVWGPGDPQTASVVAAARKGQLRLIDDGHYPIVTSHIDNTTHALELLLAQGRGGQAYYAFDDGTITIRDFLTAILAAYGLPAPTKSISRRAAWMAGAVADAFWAALRRPGQPPVSRLMVALNGGPFVVSDAKARRELGYQPLIRRNDALLSLCC